MKAFKKIKHELFVDRDGFTLPVMVPSSSTEMKYKNSLAFSDMKSTRFRKLFNRHDFIFKG